MTPDEHLEQQLRDEVVEAAKAWSRLSRHKNHYAAAGPATRKLLDALESLQTVEARLNGKSA